MSHTNICVAESDSADFEQNTWTFSPVGDFSVGAGRYAIMMESAYLELKQQRDELLAALKDAATSLETIQLRSFGEESYLNHKDQMRGYAGTRAGIARAAIAKAEAQS